MGSDTGQRSETQRPISVNMRGEKVVLGPLQRELLPLLSRWANDFAVSALAGDSLRPVAWESIVAEFEQDVKADAHRVVIFTIYEATTMRPVGTTSLNRIDHTQGTAMYGITIGDKDAWGKGYGTETTVLMLDYAFNVLGLHNVMLEVYGFNERAVRAYTRAGFETVGRRREAHRMGQQRHDVILMDCTASTFHSPLKPVLEPPH